MFTFYFRRIRKFLKKRYNYKILSSILNKEELNHRNKSINIIKDSSNFKDINNNNENFVVAEESLLREQLKRNYEFFGEDGMNKIINSFIIIIGVGVIGR